MAQIIGIDLDEVLVGTDFADVIEGRGGNDRLIGGRGSDILDGGEGIDTASYDDNLGPVQAALGANGAEGAARELGNPVTIDTLRSIENLRGSRFGDRLTGNEVDNVLEGGGGSDFINGGLGTDTASYQFNDGPVVVTLGLNGADGRADETSTPGDEVVSTDTLRSIENLVGSQFGDTLTGNERNNLFEGGAGDDIIDGGAGIDTATYEHNTGPIHLQFGSTGNGTLNEGSQFFGPEGPHDFLISIENVRATGFDDVLNGSDAGNVFEGMIGDDILNGLRGADTLDGGAGNDTLIGGTEIDLLRGGADADTFVFQSIKDSLPGRKFDQILDFERGLDHIDLSAIDAVNPFNGDDAFVVVSDPAATPQAGQLVINSRTVDQNGDGTDDAILNTVSLHVNNDGRPDFLLGVTTSLAQAGLTAADFIL